MCYTCDTRFGYDDQMPALLPWASLVSFESPAARQMKEAFSPPHGERGDGAGRRETRWNQGVLPRKLTFHPNLPVGLYI